MHYIGIDIGSTCAKTAVMGEDGTLLYKFVIPTGWSSFEALDSIKKELLSRGPDPEKSACVSTGYGRKAVAFAGRNITEITCHAKGASVLFSRDPINVIDVGGQDKKVISCQDGRVSDFYMNDKCSAGTGKFIEIMANRLNVPLGELDSLARNRTEEKQISSLCTVFAESEVVTLAGQGVSRENIAWGVLNSVAKKVSQEYSKLRDGARPVYLTGGLCEDAYFMELVSKNIGRPLTSHPDARYTGAIGAARLAWEENR